MDGDHILEVEIDGEIEGKRLEYNIDQIKDYEPIILKTAGRTELF
jgi:hypothetical protein